MAYLDSADLVARAKLRLGRPTSDEAFTVSSTDDVWYSFGTDAQTRVNTMLGTYVPEALWTVPTEISSTDNGETYTFGLDVDSEAIFAFGHFKLYENEESIPDYPLTVNVDYTIEHTNTADRGTVIRIPNNVPRTFTNGGPMAVYAAPSNVITASTQPTIPKFARTPMISDMVRRAQERLGLEQTAENDFQREWYDVLSAIRTQAHGKGGATLRRRSRSWRRGGWW